MSFTEKTPKGGTSSGYYEYQLHSKDPGIKAGDCSFLECAGTACIAAISMETDTIAKKILCVGLCTGAGATLGGIVGGPPGAAKGAVVGVIVGVKVIIDAIRDECKK